MFLLEVVENRKMYGIMYMVYGCDDKYLFVNYNYRKHGHFAGRSLQQLLIRQL